MNGSKSVVVEFFKQVLITFAAAVIAVSIVGWFVGDTTKEVGGLLSLGRDGLSYSSLFQIFIFSLTSAGIKILLFSNFLAKRMLLLWRTSLMFLSSFIAAVLLSVLFRWFPIGSWQAWLGFFISITVCFAIGILFMAIKTKLEDQKYSKLLSDYRAKQNKEGGESL